MFNVIYQRVDSGEELLILWFRCALDRVTLGHYEGSHSDWKHVKAFSSQGILNKLGISDKCYFVIFW